MKLNPSIAFQRFLLSCLGMVLVGVLGFDRTVSGQIITPMYTFESPKNLEGFEANSQENTSTISLNTNPSFVSEGQQSLKWVLDDVASFDGARTATFNPAILNDPPGVDFVRVDFINTNRLVPDPPVPDVTPTFANLSVSIFGELASNPGVEANIQFFASEVVVGTLEPGIHPIDIDLTQGGLLVGTATTKSFNDWVAEGLTIFSFQLYLNKTVGFDPTFAWTVYLDNIRAGRNVAGLQGDYNGNNTIDAADYTLWRNAFPGGPLVNDDNGMADQGDYNYWKSHFGESGGGGIASLGVAVPEPSSWLLFALGGCCYLRLRTRK